MFTRCFRQGSVLLASVLAFSFSVFPSDTVSAVETRVPALVEAGEQPQITNIWPADGAKKINIKPTVNIKSSVPIKANSWAGKITVNGGTGLISRYELNTADPTMLSIVLGKLQPFTQYEVVVDSLVAASGELEITGITTTFMTAEDVPNLFTNPGFETPNDKFNTLQGIITSEDPYMGAYSVKDISPIFGETWMYFAAPGMALDKKYAYSMYLKHAPDSPSAGNANIRLLQEPRYTSSSGEVVGAQVDISALSGLSKGDGYRRLAGTFSIPKYSGDESLPVRYNVLKLYTGSAGDVTFYFDEFEVYELIGDLAVTDEGSLFEGAQVNPSSEQLIIAFNREMAQSLSKAQISIDGVQASSVTPTDYSLRRFIITPGAALAKGAHRISITGAADAFGTSGDSFTGEFDFTVAAETRYGYSAFKTYANGAETSRLIPSAAIKAVVTGLANNSGAAGGAHLILALYRDGEFINAVFNNVALADGQTAAEDFEAQISLPDLADGSYELKVLLLENLVYITPINVLTLGE